MLNKEKTKKLSKFLSLVLRHKPEQIGIELDKNGWVNVEELIDKINSNSTRGTKIDFEILSHVVATNDKKRFAFNSDKTKIRASQGHSLKIDLGYQDTMPPEILYHGTGQKSIDSILKMGINKRNRQHVHLRSDIQTATKVGQRHGKLVILEIAAQKMHSNGHKFYLSENNVWLTDFVPVEYLKILSGKKPINKKTNFL